MKQLALAPVSVLLAVLPIAAQVQTSPAGFLTTEGNESSGIFAAKSASSGEYTFLRQLDATLVGTGARSISSLRLRRDGTGATNTTATARTLPISVRFAHGDYTKLLNDTLQPDTDWLTSAWSTLATDKSISLPDLRTKPAASPAPWSITIPLDTPFAFSGTKALAIDLRLGGSSLPNDLDYPVDAEFNLNYVDAYSTQLGTGCKPIGSNTATYHSAFGQNYGEGPTNGFLRFSVAYGPTNSAAWLLIGANNPSYELGLCAKLMSSGEISLPMTATSAVGSTSMSFDFALQPQMVGGSLYSQIVIANAGQPGLPYALSNGAQTKLPAAPLFTLACATSVAWTAAPGWQDSSHWGKNGGMVMGF